MSRPRLELLQWFGLLAAPGAWATQELVGFFLAEGRCGAAGWRSAWLPAQLALTGAAAVVAVLAELAAYGAYRQLRRVEADSPGPPGRQHLFAIGGLVGNVLFFVAIVLTGAAVAATTACRQG